MPPELADKLLEWEQKQRDGTPISPEELCADTPEIVEEFRRQIRRLAECDRVLGLDITPLGPTDPDSEVPPQIDGFEVRGRLGRGGMSDVYDAWDPTLRREVAVKVLRLPVDMWPFIRTQELAGRFSREGSVLARLEHPHIVPVYQAGVWQGRPYIAMARIGGGTLADRREEFAGKSPREVAAFMEKVARAVHAAHRQGVLHRDLKPANILMDAQGEPRVADFGLAKLWLADEPTECSSGDTPTTASELTSPGVQPGTPPYMAPEQLDAGLGPVGPATDVWALGVVLHEMLTGKRPFAGQTRRELARNVCHLPRPSCRATNKRVPRWLDGVVARCLAKAPADRYASAADLAAALRAGLHRGRQIRWLVSSAAAIALVLTAGIVGGRLLISDPDPVSSSSLPEEPPFEQEPEVVGAIERLANGEEVKFVNEAHQAPFRWVLGNDKGRVVYDDPGRLVLNSRWPGPSPVKFLPSLPPGRYHVSCTLRHVSGGDFSKVGLYVGGRQWESAEGQQICCLALFYSDWEPRVRGATSIGFARFAHVLTGDIPTQRDHWIRSDAKSSPLILTADRHGPPSVDRTLTIELDTTEARAALGPEQVGRLDLIGAKRQESSWLRSYRELVAKNKPVEPFCGGVGVIVYNGTVSIRELRIQPLK